MKFAVSGRTKLFLWQAVHFFCQFRPLQPIRRSGCCISFKHLRCSLYFRCTGRHVHHFVFRKLLSAYQLHCQTQDTQHPVLPLWVLCDSADQSRTVAMSSHVQKVQTNKHAITTRIVTVQGTVSFCRFCRTGGTKRAKEDLFWFWCLGAK